MDAYYFIAAQAGATAAGMFGGGGHGPDSTPTKAAFCEIGASQAKLCWRSSISAGVICLFIFFSSSRLDFGFGNPRSYVERSRGDPVKTLWAGAQIGFSACCGTAERGIVHGKLNGAAR